MKSSMTVESKNSKCSDKANQESSQELESLREENLVLKAAIKALTAQRNDAGEGGGGKNYDKDIEELKEITDKLKIAMSQQEQDMKVLKTKIKECGEEYKKLYLEKLKLEKKLQKERVEKSKDFTFNKEAMNKEINCFGSNSGENHFDISNLPSMPPFPMRK